MATLMLVCSVMAALALGVLLAYAVCEGLFHALRLQVEGTARPPVETRQQTVANS